METNFSMRNLSLASANVASIYTGGVKNESTWYFSNSASSFDEANDNIMVMAEQPSLWCLFHLRCVFALAHVSDKKKLITSWNDAH